MSHRARPPDLLASHERLPASAVENQLLILSPARRAEPPLCTLIHGGPIFLRVHAHSHPYVRYRQIEITIRLNSK
jgi:hypothetical protein